MSAYDEGPGVHTRRDDGFAEDLLAEDRRAEDLLAEDPRAEDLLAEDPRAEDLFAEDRRAEDLLAEDQLGEDLLVRELIAAAEPAPPRMHDGVPIRGYRGGEPIPDLGRLPQERWRDVLRPLSRSTQLAAKSTVRTVADAQAAGILVGELLLEDATALARADEAPPRMPAGAPPPPGPSRQVNYRLGPEEYARLLAAARLFAMRPTTLARVLTVRGVDSALCEARRDR